MAIRALTMTAQSLSVGKKQAHMLKHLPMMAMVLALALPVASHGTAFTLARPVNVNMGTGDAVAVADFNGDGRDDLVAAAQGHLEVRLQGADGKLTSPIRLEIPSSHINVVYRADVGGDGSVEILAGHNGGLAVYTWNGAGGFQLDDHPGAIPCINIAAGDVDGDGIPDVFCLGGYADAMMYRGDQSTGLAAPVYIQTAAMGAGPLGDIRLDDLSGDGKPELLLSSLASNSFYVYRNDGAGGFLPAVAYTYPEEHSGSTAIVAMDVDRDGVKEVVVAAPTNRPRSVLYIYRQRTNGYLELSKTMPTFDIPAVFDVSDIDADGIPDLLVGHNGWFTLGRYMGQPKSLAAAELWSSVAVAHGSRKLAVGDLDHDGYTDVALANTFGVSLLYGGRPLPSDLDGDLRSDIVWRNATEVVAWHSADSASAQALEPKDANWSPQAMGDFDGDGQADLFWRNLTTGANEIRSAGFSILLPTAAVASQDWQVAGAGDFDGDGRWDLLWRNNATGANSMWRSGDSALFQAVTSVTDLGWKVAGVGDFDGDGRADVLWRHATSGRNEIWRWARSDLRSVANTVSDTRWRVAGIGDVNGDRKDDVVWRNSATGANAIWLSGNSTTQLPLASVTDLAWSIGAVGDYNGDDRADLLWRNANTGANVIWLSADSRQKQLVATLSGWSIVR